MLARNVLLAALSASLLSACANVSHPPVIGQNAKRSGTTSLTVSADSSFYIGPFSTLNKRCALIAQAKARILKAPAHGRLRMIMREGGSGYEAGSGFEHCNDVPVRGTTLHYRPHPAYTGPDDFIFEVVFANGEKRILPYDLIIR